MAVTQQHVEEVLEQVADEGDPSLSLLPLSVLPKAAPPSWERALKAPNPRNAVLDDLWKPAARLLPRTREALRRGLQGVGLLTVRKKPPSLIYFLTRGDGSETYAYRGYAPGKVRHPKAALLPPALLEFYAVHDGWVDLFGESMGPAPSSSWAFLEDNPATPAGKFLAVFNNGGDATVGFDLRSSPPKIFTVWAEDPPEAVPDFWKRIDAWIAGQLEDLDPTS